MIIKESEWCKIKNVPQKQGNISLNALISFTGPSHPLLLPLHPLFYYRSSPLLLHFVVLSPICFTAPTDPPEFTRLSFNFLTFSSSIYSILLSLRLFFTFVLLLSIRIIWRWTRTTCMHQSAAASWIYSIQCS